MNKGRRVGTLTAGIMLIIMGLLYIAHLIFPAIEYKFILSAWPLILILLGIELIISYLINKEEKISYDGGAIALVIILTVFAMIMAGAEFSINHYTDFVKIIN